MFRIVGGCAFYTLEEALSVPKIFLLLKTASYDLFRSDQRPAHWQLVNSVDTKSGVRAGLCLTSGRYFYIFFNELYFSPQLDRDSGRLSKFLTDRGRPLNRDVQPLFNIQKRRCPCNEILVVCNESVDDINAAVGKSRRGHVITGVA